MKTVNSISALKSQIMKQMESAVTETVDESFKDLHTNVDSFYHSPVGGYSRNGQLAESPQHDGIHPFRRRYSNRRYKPGHGLSIRSKRTSHPDNLQLR